jgi:hypothetical protein
MGAARFAAVNKKLQETNPAAYEAKMDSLRYERELKIIRDKFAADLDTSRRRLTSQLVEMKRQLIASRDEVASLRSANADLRIKLQDFNATIESLKSVNTDQEKKLRACGNITRFLNEIASGGEQ